MNKFYVTLFACMMSITCFSAQEQAVPEMDFTAPEADLLTGLRLKSQDRHPLEIFTPEESAIQYQIIQNFNTDEPMYSADFLMTLLLQEQIHTLNRPTRSLENAIEKYNTILSMNTGTPAYSSNFITYLLLTRNSDINKYHLIADCIKHGAEIKQEYIARTNQRYQNAVRKLNDPYEKNPMRDVIDYQDQLELFQRGRIWQEANPSQDYILK